MAKPAFWKWPRFVSWCKRLLRHMYKIYTSETFLRHAPASSGAYSRVESKVFFHFGCLFVCGYGVIPSLSEQAN
jgi:hypothetical protein